MKARITEIEKAVEGLVGVLTGIAIDNQINDIEVDHLLGNRKRKRELVRD